VTDIILDDKILSSSAYSHVIAVPQAKIDIADWLFTLLNAKETRFSSPNRTGEGGDEYFCGVVRGVADGGDDVARPP